MLVKIKELDHLRYEVTADEEIWQYFEYRYPGKERNWKTGRFYDTTIVDHFAGWNEGDGIKYSVHKGWGIYLYSVFKDMMDEESVQYLYNDLVSTLDKNLNPDYFINTQFEDLQQLLSYKRGILQIYTSYGKTEVLARLTQHLISIGKTVLIVAGGKKAKDEIWLRINNKAPEITLPDYWNSDSNINIIAPNGFVQSNEFDENDDFFKRVDVLLADEVEMTVSESMWSIFACLKNCEYWYGVGATAEERTGKRIDIRYQIQNVLSKRTQWVVDIFGMATVFRKPQNYKININLLENKGLREIDFEAVGDSDAFYSEMTTCILSNEEYLNSIDYILRNSKSLYIPINNLNFINLICDRYSDKYKIATITGEGYWHSVEGWINLELLKELSSENQIQLLLSTVSGFRATDFRGINNILLTLGVKASSVLQYIGRVARQDAFNIWYITAGGNWKIPIYTKTNQIQLDMIYEYYKDCLIEHNSFEVQW
jgi:hypothetical protein